MAFFDRIQYGTLIGQANDMIGFDVDFGTTPPTNDEFNDGVIAMASHPHRSKAIRFQAPTGTDVIVDRAIEAFCKKWKDDGYFLIGMHDGQMTYRWQMYLDYLIIELREGRWPVFRCNELHFPIDLGPEPALPHPEPKLVLHRGKADDVTTWKWLREAHHPWHVYLERKAPLTRILYTSKKDT